jgi:protein disulfide-isomerase A3
VPRKFSKKLEKRKIRIRIEIKIFKLIINLLLNSDAIILYRAPQLANKFEPNFVKFEGKTKEELNLFVKRNL